MRKLILFLLVFASAKLSAQVYQEMPQYGYRANRMAFDSTLQIPTVCGVPTLKSIVKANKNGAIAYDSCNAKFYVYNPKTLAWSEVSGGGGGATDTTSLSNRINLKLNISDTASMLNPYLRKIDTTNKFVNSITRTEGKDSIIFFIGGNRFAIKDSVGAGGGGAFLPLTGGTLTGNLNGTTATFSSNGSSNTFNINHTSGSGHGLEITKGGNGEGLIVNKTSGSGNAVTITGTLNATTIVKNGGTSSQFLKADGSVDATTYISDTTALQRKSIPSYTFLANNTPATANAQALPFKDTSGTYTGTTTWNGTAPTSGNLTYRWTRIGKMVTINISLVYANAGSANSTIVVTLPADAPTPTKPAGLTSASNLLYPCFGGVNITNQSTLTNAAFRGFLRSNSANNGFEFTINHAAATPVNAFITCTYFTD